MRFNSDFVSEAACLTRSQSSSVCHEQPNIDKTEEVNICAKQGFLTAVLAALVSWLFEILDLFSILFVLFTRSVFAFTCHIILYVTYSCAAVMF